MNNKYWDKNFLEHDDRQRHKGPQFQKHKPFKYGSFIGECVASDHQVGSTERWDTKK